MILHFRFSVLSPSEASSSRCNALTCCAASFALCQFLSWDTVTTTAYAIFVFCDSQQRFQEREAEHEVLKERLMLLQRQLTTRTKRFA
jgi:hypothetical protein